MAKAKPKIRPVETDEDDNPPVPIQSIMFPGDKGVRNPTSHGVGLAGRPNKLEEIQQYFFKDDKYTADLFESLYAISNPPEKEDQTRPTWADNWADSDDNCVARWLNCFAAGLDPDYIYLKRENMPHPAQIRTWRKKYPDFAKAYDDAYKESADYYHAWALRQSKNQTGHYVQVGPATDGGPPQFIHNRMQAEFQMFWIKYMANEAAIRNPEKYGLARVRGGKGAPDSDKKPPTPLAGGQAAAWAKDMDNQRGKTYDESDSDD